MLRHHGRGGFSIRVVPTATDCESPVCRMLLFGHMTPNTKTVHWNGEAVGEILASKDPAQEANAGRQLLQEIGLWREPTRIQQMYTAACAFNEAAAAIYERFNTAEKRRSPAPPPLAPFVVNCAFSMEMFLKTLGEANGTKMPSKHELLELHRQLPRTTKQALEIALVEIGPQRGVQGKGFAELIRGMDKAFERWRYLHEGKVVDYFHFSESITALEVLHRVTTAAVAKF